MKVFLVFKVYHRTTLVQLLCQQVIRVLGLLRWSQGHWWFRSLLTLSKGLVGISLKSALFSVLGPKHLSQHGEMDLNE